MIVDFNAMEQNELPNFKGGEGVFYLRAFDDGKNRIMKGRLEPGASIGIHTHKGNCEIIYILSGMGHVLFEDKSLPLGPGSCHYCPEGFSHSLINDGDEELTFFAVVPTQN